MGNDLDVDDGHADGHANTLTWYELFRKSTIIGRNVQPQ